MKILHFIALLTIAVTLHGEVINKFEVAKYPPGTPPEARATATATPTPRATPTP